ncbi:MAG: agmatinase [Candidatus Lambdaproteobacteria bacterium]|nr:agmatinase [Candidatus Lambdaproteobacteria bacterium]
MSSPPDPASLPAFAAPDARVVPYAEARVAILPVPYEGTISYGGGTARGPAAILAASGQLEMYDEELDWCVDEVGFATLPPVGCAGATPEEAMRRIHAAAREPLGAGKLLVALGGEHSLSYGVWTALLERRAGRPFSLLQIDAHADLRPSYGGTPYSHASIMARAHELGLPFVQVGIRALSVEERQFLRKTGLERNVFWAHDICARSDLGWIEKVVARLGPEVYITCDIDGLDGMLMPATGTPVPGGLGWYPALRLLRAVSARRRIVGLDLTEFAPLPGLHAADFLAARLVYKMIGYATVGDMRGSPPGGFRQL